MSKESKFKKETKIGIGVIGVLLVVFGIVLFNRLGGSDVSTADANTTVQEPLKPETPPPAPTVVETGTTRASYLDPNAHDPVEQRWTSGSRSGDVDQSARRSYMPPAQTQDNLRYDERYESGQAKTVQENNGPANTGPAKTVQENTVPANTSAPYDTYASDRSDVGQNDVRTETRTAYPPATQGDQFRHRDVHAAASDAVSQYATDQPNRVADGQTDPTRQALVDDREIGRDELDPYDTTGDRAVRQNTAATPNTPIMSQEIVQQEPTPASVVATEPIGQPAIEQDAVEQVAVEQVVAPNRPATGKYTVMPNDNYSAIAKRVYGNSGYFKALAEYNREAHPRIHNLQVGDEVLTPELIVLRDKFGSLCPKLRTAADPIRRNTLVATTGPTKVYVVEEGDTIYDIAKYELGKASRWAEIIALNRTALGSDIHFVRPGMRLRLPAVQPETQQPETQQPSNRVVREAGPDAAIVR